MDFLDPVKQRRARLLLIVGYGLIALIIMFATYILWQVAYGFSYSHGKVVQHGLVFLSSQPGNATVYVDNQPNSATTNTSLLLLAGSHSIKLSEDGYRSWQRQIDVIGGDVQRFDYPILFPNVLTAKPLANLSDLPDIASQSPDKRWLLIEQPSDKVVFNLYDLRDNTIPPVKLSLPATAYNSTDSAGSWQVIGWADDNKHLLLKHDYVAAGQAAAEYILLDSQTPASSLNLTANLKLAPSVELSLLNNKYDHYYLSDAAAGTLSSASLGDTVPVLELNHVVAFKPYGSDTLLYVTDQLPKAQLPAGQVAVVLRQGDKTYVLRQFASGAPNYLLDMATYGDDWYVVLGASGDKVAYVYKNPQQTAEGSVPRAFRALKVDNPNYVSFSDTARFIMAENGSNFSVFDAQTSRTYNYAVKQTLDSPQTHADWMDGDRIMFISGGQLTVLDYDNQNLQTLQPASSFYIPFFEPDYRAVYTLAPPVSSAGQSKLQLTYTSLIVLKK
ncbi:MAG: PEGA domain-containing protein [Candidatus Saccharimonadales bacterium]